jgi:hypothetical protein
MSPAELETAARLLFGSDRFGFGWQRPLARVLRVDERRVRRWAAGALPIPPEVPGRLYELAADRRGELARLMEGLR